MRAPQKVASIALLFSSIVIGLLARGLCHEEYPWIRYFERPDMPTIHCAFADACGSVVVSTGDWNRVYKDPPYIVYEYWSEGVYSIATDSMDSTDCLADTYVLDGAVDAGGRTWLLVAEGIDMRVYSPDSLMGAVCARPTSDVGYRKTRYPHGQWNRLQDYRFGWIDQSRFTEQPNLARTIPGRPNMMFSGPLGRVFVVSQRMETNGTSGDFLSWWDGGMPEVVHTLNISEILLPLLSIRDYPVFAPDSAVCFIITYSVDESTEEYEYAVLCLNPDTEEWDLCDREDFPLLDSAIEYFHVDDNNVKWFGTENGLVVFDGQNWLRFTSDNSSLPYNLVRQIEYDEIDDVYYVVSQTGSSGEYYTAFSILNPDGTSAGASLYFPITSYPWDLPKIYRDARETLWLVHPYGYEIYSYDHQRVIQWDTADWMEDLWPVGYIGSDSNGRTFLVTPTCVMIW